MSHYITTHDQNNKSVFSNSSTSKRPAQVIGGTTVETVYAFQECPPDISSEYDIKQHDQNLGLDGSKFMAVVGNFPPHAETPFHRTMSVNIGVVLEGTVELHLDSGEVRTMVQGDSYTQRGTMHKWKNPTDQWVRIATFTLPIVEPFQPNGEAIGVKAPWSQVLGDVFDNTSTKSDESGESRPKEA